MEAADGGQRCKDCTQHTFEGQPIAAGASRHVAEGGEAREGRLAQALAATRESDWAD